MRNPPEIILHLGSNMGDRFDNLSKAIDLIDERLGKPLKQSHYYETEAWGLKDQHDFINKAIFLHSSFAPAELLQELLEIEKQLGRVRDQKWAPRLIDIDLLFYGDLVLETKGLSLPHPRLHLRNFVLIPLLEIVPDFVHPIFKKSIEELYIESRDKSEVILLTPE